MCLKIRYETKFYLWRGVITMHEKEVCLKCAVRESPKGMDLKDKYE